MKKEINVEDKRMEQESHNYGEEGLPQSPEVQESPETQRIREGIAEALRGGEPIDHETAWLIARSVTPGSGAIHQLAMTGEITPEIGSDLEAAYEVLPELADTWIAALDGYCFRRRDKGPVPGWPRENEL
jgi:hypothetical protein